MSTHLLHLHLHPGQRRHVDVHSIAMLLLLQRHQQRVLLRLHRLHARKARRSSACATTPPEIVWLVLAVLAPAQHTRMQNSTSTAAQSPGSCYCLAWFVDKFHCRTQVLRRSCKDHSN
jgi:hypothetical protein